MTANPELILRWSGGELNLDGWNVGEYGEFEILMAPDGANFGNPEPVRRILRSALLDGSASVKERDDNRTIELQMRVSAADGTALAGGEIPLALADGRRCELVWTPPDEFAPPAVFVAVSVDLAHDSTRDAEELALLRYYTLTLDCLPHAYSDEYVTIPAVAQGISTPVLVDDCTSLTGWSADDGVTLTLSGDRIVGSRAATTFAVTRVGDVDLTSHPYLSCDSFTLGVAHSLVLQVRSAGGAWEALPQIGVDGTDRVFDATGLADPLIASIRFVASGGGGDLWLVVKNIEKQATPRSEVSQQQSRTLEAPGSARTPASLLVESPTTGLGTVLVYSGPAYNPDVTRGALGARSSDADPALSGGYTAIADGATESFEVRASEFFDGDHSLWLRAKTGGMPTLGTLTLTATVLTPDDEEIASEVVGAARLGSIAYALTLVGSANLPLASLPAGSTAKIRFDALWEFDGTGSSVYIDALLAFNRTRGALTVAEAGTRKKVWLDSATIETDRPVAYVGDGEKSDAVPLSLFTELPSWPGAHVIEAPVTYLYVGATDADDAEVSATFRPAWHTHPAS